MSVDRYKKRELTLAAKTLKSQIAFLEELAKTGIVQLACNKSGIGRSTYYDWCNRYSKFYELAQKAIRGGRMMINDVAESQLLRLIQSGNITSLIFWLKNHHVDYSDKMVHNHTHQLGALELTDDERDQISRALKLTGLDKVLSADPKPRGKKTRRGGLDSYPHKIRGRGY